MWHPMQQFPYPSSRPSSRRPRRLAVAPLLGSMLGSMSLSFNVGMSLGVGAIAGLGSTVIHPPVAQAYVSRLALALNHSTGETYETLVRRAEVAARAAAQRLFDSDILISQVSVVVSASYVGLEVPVLSLDVSRFQWRGQPDVRRWATYYPTSRSLLGLGRGGTAKPPATPRTTPPTTPAAQPTPPANPAAQPTPALPTQPVPATAPGRRGTGAAAPLPVPAVPPVSPPAPLPPPPSTP